jgi:hypothetical protein
MHSSVVILRRLGRLLQGSGAGGRNGSVLAGHVFRQIALEPSLGLSDDRTDEI